MKKELKTIVVNGVNASLGLLNLKLIRSKQRFVDYRDYIPFEETIEGAKQSNLSVGDYIDAKHNKPGATQDTIDEMTKLGVFAEKIDRVCEIGPGSGRYLDKVLQLCHPSYCEVYETAEDWKNWLVQQYDLIAQPTDGKSLSSTPSESIDLIQAHKVLPGQPSLITFRYFTEMARVVNKGGKIVFDIVTEECFDDATLENWLATGRGYQHYPALMSKQFTIDFFARRNCAFVGSFFIPMKPGKTECMVFAKK
ncbi:hypothetical protein [Waterburya agarophytonicola]|uniref:hypothetical protein n=1 Tax=Waterburya agarophytonicola TaxID=2886916 RepID=UPI001E4C0821|nr:hypothetical protein [Waterburya agarophytonicola]